MQRSFNEENTFQDQTKLKQSLLSQEQIKQNKGQDEENKILEKERQKEQNEKHKLMYANKYLTRLQPIGGKHWYSKLIFAWVNPILSYGRRIITTLDVLPQLPREMSSEGEFNRLQNILSSIQKSERKGFTLIRALGKAFWRQFVWVLVFALLSTAATMALPVLTRSIIQYIDNKQSVADGLGLLIFVFILSLGKIFSQAHLNYQIQKLGYNLNNGLSLVIYNKTLQYAIGCEKQYTVSDITNYSQVDADRVTYMGQQLTAIIFTPLMIIVGIGMMYNYIGLSFFSGIGVMAIMMLCTFFLTKKSIRYNAQLLKAKDQRMRVTQQMLDNIRFIKTTAVQKHYFNKINRKRNAQLILFRKRGLVEACIIALYWSSTPFILAATFLTYTALGNPMTAEVAFTVIIIFNILQYPIRLFPTAFSQLIQIFSSIVRIEKYLFALQIDFDRLSRNLFRSISISISISHGNFYYGKDLKNIQILKNDASNQIKSQNAQKILSQKVDIQQKHDESIVLQSNQSLQQKLLNQVNNQQQQQIEQHQQKSKQDLKNKQLQINEKYTQILFDINIKIQNGSLTMILGQIGSGKSTLLLSMLNQTKTFDKKTKIEHSGSLAYLAQKPLIQSMSVRDNITFTLPYDSVLFKWAVRYAALEQDLQMFQDGERTIIGEKGVTLSGGQKARVAFARALYSQRDIYLLDDLLSAVDVHVADFIMKQTILQQLKGKTIILVTHSLKYVQFASRTIIIKKGRIVTNTANVQQQAQFLQLCKNQTVKQAQLKNKQEQLSSSQLLEACDQEGERIKKEDKSKIEVKEDAIDKVVQELMLPQDHKAGNISNEVFKQYVRNNGGAVFVLIILGAMSLWISFSTLSNIWMEKWCQDPLEGNGDFYIYISFALTANIGIFTRVYILVRANVLQGERVHKKIIKSLLYAPLNKFYNRVPMGRIINRLTKDLRDLDESMTYTVGNFIASFFIMIGIHRDDLGTITICLYASTAYVLIPLAVVAVCCFKLQRYYMRTQQQVSRFRKSSNTPVVSGFLSLLQGVHTIRAYGLQKEFLAAQCKVIDRNKSVLLTGLGMSNWFTFRLALFSFVVNSTAITYCMFSSNSNSSLAGLLMSYALNLSEDIISLTASWAYLQQRMVSLERVYTFTNIEPENGYKQYLQKWRTREEGYQQPISHGQVVFEGLSARHRSGLPCRLNQINLRIEAGTKAGVIGRTGAGKTTLLNALLGLLEITQGKIFIGDKQIQDYFLKDLRNAITMIDQDPTLMESDFRENLDVAKQYSDQEIWNVLQQCGLKETVVSRGGLKGEVNNVNLSAGQKQLLCICRAFLRKSKLVLIDEATANIDMKNDNLIQNIFQTKFSESTVITIAHRLTTLKHCDKIIVMDQGYVIEQGPPLELENKKGGHYAQMLSSKDTQWLK